MCYDGAANMSGSRTGVKSHFLQREPRALFTHCYGHSLNLAVGDALKNNKVCRDALDVAFEVSKLIRFSPKRSAALHDIKVSNPMEDEGPMPTNNIRSFCPTRWTVRGDAIASILNNFEALKQLWLECLDSRLDPDVKGRIIGVRAQMQCFDLVFGLDLSMKILKISDNLSRTLRSSSMSAADGQEVAELTMHTLQGMRAEEYFILFFEAVKKSSERYGTELPTLPRKRKAPIRFEDGTGDGFHPVSVEDHIRLQYYEALDSTIAGIKNRFNQPGYMMYKSVECFLLNAANKTPFEEHFKKVMDLYKDDFDSNLLSAQLQVFSTAIKPEAIGTVTRTSVSLRDCIQFLRDLSPAKKLFFSEICLVAKLVLVMPATNAVSKRCFSAMRRLKTYLRSSMGQSRLNHIMIRSIYKEEVDNINIDLLGDEFIRGSEHRLQYFGKFIS